MRQEKASAFTLVELMVAILILLIGVTSILAILPLAFNIQQNSKDVILSEIVARNASAMLSARKIKYSDLRKSMLTAEFDVFQPMAPRDYPGGTEFRADGHDDGASSNALLYADTGRMAFPLPNGRVSNYDDLVAAKGAGRVTAARGKLLEVFDRYEGARFNDVKYDIQNDINLVYDSYVLTEGYRAGKTIGRAIVEVVGFYQWYIITSTESTVDTPKASRRVNTADMLSRAETAFNWDDLLGEVKYTTGGKNDFDERPAGYGLTSSGNGGAARERSRHLWGYNFSENMMGTHEGSGSAPAYLWTIRDRSFPSLSSKAVSKRDYFWVPLLYDADPRPGRFEWRAYIVVTVRYPGRNYKYQGQVHTDHSTSVQAFAANPRDPELVPRVTAIPMDMADSSVKGDAVSRYNGTSYTPLNWVYYPDWPDTTATATIQAFVSRGVMSKQDNYLTTPNDKAYHHGQVSGRFIPGDKFAVTVGQPYINYLRDFQSNGWVLAGATPTQILKAGSHNSGSGLRHPIPFNDTHYNPRNSSFQLWCWMSHSNGIGRLSVGRVMPVSGQVVDMSN